MKEIIKKGLESDTTYSLMLTKIEGMLSNYLKTDLYLLGILFYLNGGVILKVACDNPTVEMELSKDDTEFSYDDKPLSIYNLVLTRDMSDYISKFYQ